MEILTDVNLVEKLIGTFGFPITLVIYLLWDRSKTETRYEKTNASFRNAIEGNTKVIHELLVKLERDIK